MKAVKRSRVFFSPFFSSSLFFFLFLDFVFVNVTTAGKLIFPRRGEKKKKEKKRIKGENLCFFFPFFQAWLEGLATRSKTIYRRNFNGTVPARPCWRGPLHAFFLFLLWGEVGTIYFALRGDGSGPEERESIDPSGEEPGVVGRKVQ